MISITNAINSWWAQSVQSLTRQTLTFIHVIRRAACKCSADEERCRDNVLTLYTICLFSSTDGTEYTWAATTHWFIRMNLMHNFRYTFVLLRQELFLVNIWLDRNTKLATYLAWKYSILIENNYSQHDFFLRSIDFDLAFEIEYFDQNQLFSKIHNWIYSIL